MKILFRLLFSILPWIILAALNKSKNPLINKKSVSNLQKGKIVDGEVVK